VTRRDPGIVHVKLSQLQLRRPRQWGACRLALLLWQELQLDRFWSKRLGVSRKGTRWDQVLLVLVANRLPAPGSEWRLHREWFQRSALADLLGEDAGPSTSSGGRDPQAVPLSRPAAGAQTGGVRSPDGAVARPVQHQLRRAAVRSDEYPGLRRGRLYFEADPPFREGDKRRYGDSRDHRPDCVQIVIALVVTPEGLPLAYEVLPGNTADKTTLRGFLERIEGQYGKACPGAGRGRAGSG
jgi:hypothetical protein